MGPFSTARQSRDEFLPLLNFSLGKLALYAVSVLMKGCKERYSRKLVGNAIIGMTFRVQQVWHH